LRLRIGPELAGLACARPAGLVGGWPPLPLPPPLPLRFPGSWLRLEPLIRQLSTTRRTASCQIASNCVVSAMAHCHNRIAYGAADLGVPSYQRIPSLYGRDKARSNACRHPASNLGDVSGHTRNWLAAAALALHHSLGMIRNARLSAAVGLDGWSAAMWMLQLGDGAARELEQQAK
jgi:hypothetical protein